MISHIISGALIVSGITVFNKAIHILSITMKCPICPEVFESDTGLISHIKISHSNLINIETKEGENMGFFDKFKKKDESVVDKIMNETMSSINTELPKEIEVKNEKEVKEYFLTVHISLSDFEAGKRFLDNIPDILERDKYAEIIEASIKKGE